MTGIGRSPTGRADAASQSNPQAVSSIAAIPSAEYDDFDDHDCANCGGEGFTLGCSWDWQCDTYDAGEGTCLCERRCDWCNPAPRNPELGKVLADALKAETQHPGMAMCSIHRRILVADGTMEPNTWRCPACFADAGELQCNTAR